MFTTRGTVRITIVVLETKITELDTAMSSSSLEQEKFKKIGMWTSLVEWRKHETNRAKQVNK